MGKIHKSEKDDEIEVECVSPARKVQTLFKISKNLNEFLPPENYLEILFEALKDLYHFDLLFLSDISDTPIVVVRSSEYSLSNQDLNSLLTKVLDPKWNSGKQFLYLTKKEASHKREFSKFGIKSLFAIKVSTILFPEYFFGFINFNNVFMPVKEDINFLHTLAHIINQSISYYELKSLFETSYDKLQVNVERIQRENEQRRELLKKVREQTKELQRRHIEMEEFVYTISHDLKAPIISIQGFVTALNEDFSKSLPKEAQYYLERIIKNTAQIESMIREVLEYSRIGRITQEKEKLDLKEIIDDIISPQIQKKNIKIGFKGKSLKIYAEKNRMLQLFGNLIGNSVKYMGDQPEPRIEVGTQKIDSKFATIFVKDNGIGIPEKFKDKVFNIFVRASNLENKDIEGTGIGLAHCKKIVETHGGQIWLESEEGKGTAIFLQLPLAI
ncbi:MAG: HAMP domain-containing histidine kinase [Candidatus Heimdallarchaeota archaeon]|nr:MAG: HAMP domain-containing histidine kinase [Candidatus Heimdallarchaeota archaeon]